MVESKLWVVCEVRQGALASVGLEMLGRARELARAPGWSVAAVLVGPPEVAGLADTCLVHGAQEVLVAADARLARYCNTAPARVLAQAIGEHRPQVVLLGATALGVDLAPRLAARLRTGLAAHCLDLELDESGALTALVPGWGGGCLARISCPVRRPQMATVMPGVWDQPTPVAAKGRVVELAVELDPADFGYEVLRTVREPTQASPLDGAAVVVAGGWGVGDQAHWRLLDRLAAVLGGAVGATRPPVDQGWAEHNQMIGTSGRAVSPKLYVAVGISGNPHHMVGVKHPGLAVAINQDPRAAIFNHCDLGLVGDCREIIPALLDCLAE